MLGRRRLAGIVSPQSFGEIRARADIPATRLAASENVNRKHFVNLLGVTGFEPATSWSQTTRSTKLSYTPASGKAV